MNLPGAMSNCWHTEQCSASCSLGCLWLSKCRCNDIPMTIAMKLIVTAVKTALRAKCIKSQFSIFIYCGAFEKVPPWHLRLPRDSSNRLPGAKLAMTWKYAFCHCEERSDEAISTFSTTSLPIISHAHAGHRPSSRTCWRWMIKPPCGLLAIGRDMPVKQCVLPQRVQVK